MEAQSVDVTPQRNKTVRHRNPDCEKVLLILAKLWNEFMGGIFLKVDIWTKEMMMLKINTLYTFEVF